MRTKILIFGLLWLCIFVSSQSIKYTYYIEFANSNNKPTITKIGKTTKSIAYNDNQYEVIQYEEAFSNFTTESLRNTSLVEFKTLNDFNNFVFNNRNNIVTYNKVETLNHIILLEKIHQKSKQNRRNLKKLLYTTPNDYYLYPADTAHSYLDLINAKEAWDYSNGDNITVGISDNGFRLSHHEFVGKISTIPGQTVNICTTCQDPNHGSVVAGLAAANTDNNFGNSSVGFNAKLMVTDSWGGSSWNNLKLLSQNGAKVINMSWADSCSPIPQVQTAINEIYANGTVLVAAAGNSTCGSTYAKVYPASYQNVIAVSGVGHYHEIGTAVTTNVKDVHYSNYAILQNRLQNNEDVDIVAPAYDMDGLPYVGSDTDLFKAWIGTSLASPLVSGSVALLFSSNSCLSPIEVETILKLTSANIDQMPLNQPFAGLLGAGRLDVGKANKMAWQMNPANGGEVLIENKNFTRWNFELLNSAEYIRIQNESFTGSSNVNFKAKKGITLTANTLLQPGTGKKHFLYVENIDTCSDFNKSENSLTKTEKKVSNAQLPKSNIKLYPNPSKDYINVQTEGEIQRIDIFDLSGKIVKTNYYNNKVNIENLPKGNYLVKIQLVNGNTETITFIKN